MIAWLQRVLDPAYLYALNTGPLGRWGAVYLLWAVVLLLGVALALWWSVRSSALSRTVALVITFSCGAGLLAVILRLAAPYLTRRAFFEGLSPAARYLLLEAWTARVWPLCATLSALMVFTLYVLSRLRLPIVQAHVDALVGTREQSAAYPIWQSIVLACAHLAGLAWLWHVAGRPMWWAVPSLAGLALLSLLARTRRPRLESLGPMFVAYLSAWAYFCLSRWLGIDVDEYGAYALPDPWSPWFDVPAVVTASVTLTLLTQLGRVFCSRGSAAPKGSHAARSRCAFLPLGLALLVGLWLVATVAIHRTYGVTASDPYCYVQMAIDLAERGTAQHTFPLAGLARDLGLPTWPVVHIGYHPPGLDNRAPTMWSIGWPLLMAPLYRLGGLETLYWAAPLMGGLALVATWLLVDEALRDLSQVTRWTVAALTCALVATSPEGSERILVPMADAAAQLCTVLTLWLLLRGQRARGALNLALYGALAGLCFGLAYFVRHPQLPLGLAALVAALTMGQSKKRGMETAPTGFYGRPGLVRALMLLVPFGLAALLIALPDLFYHRAAFGHWFHSESSEWFLLSARYVGSSFWSILQQGLLRREETGYLVPLILYGAWLLRRSHRRAAWVLISGALAVFLFHLFYAALRPRDLIAILPVLYFCAAYGLVTFWRWAQRRRTVLSAWIAIVCTVFLLARSYRTLSLPWRADVITFGHVRASQLQEFHRLRQLTTEDSVIGSMLNSGAIELHAGRAAVHPTPWTDRELARWVEALSARNRPFYVLDDGEEMADVLALLGRRYRVQPVATLGLPYFAIGGGNLPRNARLYRIEVP